jgi:hypothetical protein
MHHNRILIVALLLSAGALLANPGEIKLKMHSANQLKQWATAINEYRDQNGGKHPPSLEALKPLVTNYDQLIENPLTGDNPGYELVANPAGRNPVWMYQIRQGKRDESLDVLFADGTVKPLKD